VDRAHTARRTQDAKVNPVLCLYWLFQLRPPFEDGKPVRKRLRRVFARSIAGIDERYAKVAHNLLDRFRFRVPHDHHIAISIEHFSNVTQRLSLGDAGTLSLRYTEDLSIEAHSSTLKRQTRARARFKECGDDKLAIQRVTVGNLGRFEQGSKLAQFTHHFPVKLRNGNH